MGDSPDVSSSSGDKPEGRRSPRSLGLAALFAPLIVPSVILTRGKELDADGNIQGQKAARGADSADVSSMSSFDLSSLTPPNYRSEQDASASGLNNRLSNTLRFLRFGGDTLSGDQVQAFEKARDMARSIALEEAAEAELANSRSRQWVLLWSAFLFVLSFAAFCSVPGGMANREYEFTHSVLADTLADGAQQYLFALFFSVGAAAPMLFHFLLQLVFWLLSWRRQGHSSYGNSYSYSGVGTASGSGAGSGAGLAASLPSLVIIVSCALMVLTIFSTNVVWLVWFAQGRDLVELAPFYPASFGFQLNAYKAVSCGLVTYHLPDRWVFRGNYILHSFCFIMGINVFVYCQQFPSFDYNVGQAIAWTLLAVGFSFFLIFLVPFVKLFCRRLPDEEGEGERGGEGEGEEEGEGDSVGKRGAEGGADGRGGNGIMGVVGVGVGGGVGADGGEGWSGSEVAEGTDSAPASGVVPVPIPIPVPARAPGPAKNKTSRNASGSANRNSRNETVSMQAKYIVMVSIIGNIIFLITDFISQVRVRSVRSSNFDEFLICWHVYTKTALMIAIAYLLPLQLSEMRVVRSKQTLGSFVNTLSSV